jgi:hypothetical protein
MANCNFDVKPAVLRPFLSVDTNEARSIVSPIKVKTGFLGLLSRTQCNTQRELRLHVTRRPARFRCGYAIMTNFGENRVPANQSHGPARPSHQYSYPIGRLGEQI